MSGDVRISSLPSILVQINFILIPLDKMRNNPPGRALGSALPIPIQWIPRAAWIQHEYVSHRPIHSDLVARSAREKSIRSLWVRADFWHILFFVVCERHVLCLLPVLLAHPLLGLPVVCRGEVAPRHVGHCIQVGASLSSASPSSLSSKVPCIPTR